MVHMGALEATLSQTKKDHLILRKYFLHDYKHVCRRLRFQLGSRHHTRRNTPLRVEQRKVRSADDSGGGGCSNIVTIRWCASEPGPLSSAIQKDPLHVHLEL